MASKSSSKGRKAKVLAAGQSVRDTGDRLSRPDGSLDRILFDRYGSYVGELYDPENSSGTLGPSIYPHQGAARRKPFDITHTALADNEVVVFKMFPRVAETILASAGGTVPAPATDNMLGISFEATVNPETSVGGFGLAEVAMGGVSGEDFELPLVPATINALPSNYVGASTPAGSAVSFVILNRGSDSCQVRVAAYDPVAAAWVNSPFYSVPGGGQVSGSFSAASLANGTTRWCVQYRNGSSSTRALKISTRINLTTSVLGAVLTYPTATNKGYSVFESAQALDELVVRAMSMRLTCMGDLTTTGGRVACALVPREFVPDPVDPVGSIAALPTGNYDGKLIDGAHIMWQPREAQDFTFAPPEIDDGSHYIVIACVLAKQNTVIRLKASFNYEVFTLDPNLGAMAWCPSGFGLLEVLTAVFSAVGPASANDSHLQKKKGALAAMKRLASRSVEWVMKNPSEAAAMAAKAIALLAI